MLAPDSPADKTLRADDGFQISSKPAYAFRRAVPEIEMPNFDPTRKGALEDKFVSIFL